MFLNSNKFKITQPLSPFSDLPKYYCFGKVFFMSIWGWSGGAKVSCFLCHRGGHRGVQLILAYSWARPAILVAGKGREVMFLFLLFLYFHSCSSFFPVPLFHLFYYLFCLFSPFLWETTQNKSWRVVKPQHNQFMSIQPITTYSEHKFHFFYS